MSSLSLARTVRSGAIAAIVGLSVATTSVMTPVAWTQESSNAGTAGQRSNEAAKDSPTINQDFGTLTIHKRVNADEAQDSEGTSTRIDGPAGQPHEGVRFKVTRVKDIDLKTNAGLAEAGRLSIAEARDRLDIQNSKTVTTGSDGTAVVDNLPVGVYLVEEVSAEGQTPDDNYIPAAPFLAFIPHTVGDGAGTQGTHWNYDVHAYPKNYNKPEPVKRVIDVNQDYGGTLTYEIRTSVRDIAEGKQLGYYYISDTLDTTRLDVAEDKVKVTVIHGGNSMIDPNTPLVAGSDYQVTVDTKTGRVLVGFLKAGLAKLSSRTKITVRIEVPKLSHTPMSAGDPAQPRPAVANIAYEYEPLIGQEVDPDPQAPEPPVPPTGPPPVPEESRRETSAVYTLYGDVEFTKVDSTGSALAGAEFVLLRTGVRKGIEGNKPDQSCHRDLEAEKREGSMQVTALFNNGDTEELTDIFRTGPQGLVKISGLHVSDWVDHAPVIPEDQQVYCLYEVKAPAGKERLTKPLEFRLTSTTNEPKLTTTDLRYQVFENGQLVTDAVKSIEVPRYETLRLSFGNLGEGKVVNIDSTVPRLPLTGGLGIGFGLVAALGALIIALGAWFARRSLQR